MKEKVVSICLLTTLLYIFILTGCANEIKKTNVEPITHFGKYQNVKHIGQVPDALEKVVKNNLFKDIVAFDGKLLKTEICDEDEKNKTITQKVQMMDIYGNELASYMIDSNDAYHITILTATDDGGFLFVLGFEDYTYDQDVWASDNGYASRVIKCDKKGNLQFDTQFNGVEGEALEFCFEKDEQFYFFGTKETPETKTRGVYSPTDVYMSILDRNGTILKSQCIAGSDFDYLEAVKYTDNCFLLSICSQSNDGDFSKSYSRGDSDYWIIEVNDNLEITEQKRGIDEGSSNIKIGEKEGKPIYNDDVLFKNFNAGTLSAFIDYDDFYLIVSENVTGVYENTPSSISSFWCYTETVYSGYNKNGKLIFRTAIDSSPNYDEWAQES